MASKISCAVRMSWYSFCHISIHAPIGVGRSPVSYPMNRGSVLVKLAASRDIADMSMPTLNMSFRELEKRPRSACCSPVGVAGTCVGAVRNGTLVSLQAAATISAAAPVRSAPLRRSRRPAGVVCVLVMSESQVEAKEDAAGRGIRRDLASRAHRLVASEADLRVQAAVARDHP